MDSTKLSNIISIVDILVTILVGYWIGVSVQNNHTKNRYLKEYFIQEIKNLRDDYKTFFNGIYKGTLSSTNIKDWFKVMSGRIYNINSFIADEYATNDELIILKHSEIQKFITLTEEFNNDFSKDCVRFNASTKVELFKLNSELTKDLIQKVIDINKCHKKAYSFKSILKIPVRARLIFSRVRHK